MGYKKIFIRVNNKLYYFVERAYLKVFYKREDRVVINFLKKNSFSNFLEVGSGKGRFAHRIKDLFSCNITCVEINNDLATKTNENGLFTINKDIYNTGLADEQFDVVHCSHVIEHLPYPKVVAVLDELFRITKTKGYMIIRSPLMNKRFYNDIDHIRPYPPEAVLEYINARQQQKQSIYNLKEIIRWYRRTPYEIIGNSELAMLINSLIRIFWILFWFPFIYKTGYVMVLQKID